MDDNYSWLSNTHGLWGSNYTCSSQANRNTYTNANSYANAGPHTNAYTHTDIPGSGSLVPGAGHHG